MKRTHRGPPASAVRRRASRRDGAPHRTWPRKWSSWARLLLGAVACAVPAVALMPSLAFAHIYGGDGGPGAGFMHPLTGVDHLLAMYAVGLLSAVLGGRAIWTVPGAFVAMMTVGGLVGMLHLPLSGAEAGVALSVIVLGAAVAIGPSVPALFALLAAGVFGLLHGYAHGAEMPSVSSPGLYVLGFVAATAGLHVLGALSGLLAQCRPTGAYRVRLGGAAIATVGVFLLLSLVRTTSIVRP
jgi:urease accessory protein